MLSLKSITEICLYSKDLIKSEHFYAEILGLELIDSTDNHVFFRVGEQVLLIFDPNHSKTQEDLPGHFAHGNQHIAFTATKDQYETWKNRVLSHGVTVIKEHTWKRDLKSFYFRDPDDHVIEILEGNIWI